MVEVDYKPRREMFRLYIRFPSSAPSCIIFINICSRQLSLSNCNNGAEDRNGSEQHAETDKQNRTEDLESVLNNTTQSNPTMRKYIKRRKSVR